MTIEDYIKTIGSRYKTGISTEHTFRGDLQSLLESILTGVMVTNEPVRVACGAPDYILTKKNIPIGYIEAKDLGADLLSKNYKEQFSRYKASLGSIVFTNYLDFHFYRDGELLFKIELAEIDGKKINPLPQNYSTFINYIEGFATHTGQTIKSPKKLAEMMAAKAKLLAEVIEKSLTKPIDPEHPEAQEPGDNTLQDQLRAFQQILIHDIDAKEFADIYAQTLAYGMFAARLHDPNLDTFSRQEAAELIPKSNPFLRKLFQYIAGYDLDNRIKWIVDDLADIFRATDVNALLHNFGQSTLQTDPIIHFYETFLAEYDPKLRKARGVWYTPEPVVNFIVRAVDDILKDEFGLKDGLADTSKTKIKVQLNGKNVEKEVHKVQILDPATGTGTFLAEVIKQVHSKFEGQKGIWNNYVEDHLIPRLNGFEILMASYAMAHLKLDLLLTETGFKAKKDQRLRVYLTNSLEEHHPETGTLFASWLSNEANEANHVKRDTPVMVVMGNPPYSGESTNNGEWIMNLMEDYKKEPGGIEKLNERNPKWINDDYVKFLRYGQHFIEKNGEGVLAFINAHGFLDNPTFRGMRWNLLKAYDKIYILDLHGNSKKKEVSPDGNPDVNVFDIQQGVSINLMIKTRKKSKTELAKVYHFDLYGRREMKYDYLFTNTLSKVAFTKLENLAPNYFFTQKNFKNIDQYNSGFSVNELFLNNGVGMTTAHDEFVINEDKLKLLQKFNAFKQAEPIPEELHRQFDVKNKKGWKITDGWLNLQHEVNLEKFIQPVSYRPFDKRFIFYEDKLVWRTVRKVMEHFIKGDNMGLVIGRQGQVVGSMQWNLVFVSDCMTDFNFYYRGGGVLFPVYQYSVDNSQSLLYDRICRTPNLRKEIVKSFCEGLETNFTPEKEEENRTIAPIDILDYIYTVLHSPNYREKYKEFLKIDFPRVPYPTDKDTFWQLVKLGGELRQLHLLESAVLDKFITEYPEVGDNKVGKIKYKGGSVWINDTQFFSGVPPVAWEFYIGGYQPAQKWLKDRKDRILSYEDIQHYQRIIVALTETDRLMRDIDKIEHDLW